MVPTVNAAKLYYDTTPDGSHRTGDVWKGLPTFGLLGGLDICSGVVITPACDLAHDKSSTITYLPVISVPVYLGSLAGYSLVRPAMVELLQDRLKIAGSGEFLLKGTMPSVEEIDYLSVCASDIKCDRSTRERVDAGFLALRYLQQHRNEASKQIKMCLPVKDWRRFRDGIVTNSFADDVHFLPAERPVGEWSAIPVPSLVLFRYPMTVPRSFLDKANDGSLDWAASARGMSPQFVSVSTRPLRALRLQKEFLSDLLTRFARLYVRIGSKDFTRDAVESFGLTIDKECES